MNPAYQQVRFKAELPEGGLPMRFGIVTACNPDGRSTSAAENAAATEALRGELTGGAEVFFPVTGGSADFVHAEPGFGIALNTRAESVALGRRWRQEAVFWIEAGEVELVPCGDGESSVIGAWSDLAEPPAHQPRFHFLGDVRILRQPKTAFFCSAKCPGDVILRTHDAAAGWRDEGRVVVSGFHSPVERDCLRILLRGTQPIIICPARALPQRVPPDWKMPLAAGRLLVLSAFATTAKRITSDLAAQRNDFVAALADEVFIAHVTVGGHLEALTSRLRARGIPLLNPVNSHDSEP
jgi:Protein of unknown function (DUF3293)